MNYFFAGIILMLALIIMAGAFFSKEEEKNLHNTKIMPGVMFIFFCLGALFVYLLIP